MCRSSNRPNNPGFLLLEVTLTVAVLSVGIVLVLQAFRTSLQAIRRVEDLTLATWLAQGKLAEVSLLTQEARKLEEIPLEGDFPENPPFHWKIEEIRLEGKDPSDRLVPVRLIVFKEEETGEGADEITVVQELLQKLS